MTWLLHVEEEFSAAHHNGPEGHRCNKNHGHDWKAEIEILYFVLDAQGWGPDFGAIKALIKPLDHNDLNDYFPFPPSAENIARWLYEEVGKLIGAGGSVEWVRIHEGGGNSVQYYSG